MFGNPSLNTRIAVGKTLGALFGLAGFIYLTHCWTATTTAPRLSMSDRGWRHPGPGAAKGLRNNAN